MPVLVVTSASLAQVAPKPPNWDTLRRAELTGPDRQNVQKWVDAQVRQLLTSENPQQPGAAFFAQMHPELRHPQATRPYREGLAQITAESFARHYQARRSAPAPPKPMGVVYVLMLLRTSERPEALSSFQAALSDPSPAVRAVAADGLLRIREQLKDAQWTALLPELQKAAAAETVGPVLGRLYRLLQVDAETKVSAVVSVIRDVLDRRLVRFEAQGELPAVPDAEAAAWLVEKASKSANAQTKNQIALRVARLLADAVHPYVRQSPGDEQERVLEQVILSAEARLKVLVPVAAGGPSVTSAMLAGGDAQADKMAAELDKWIGTADREGLLNKPPLSFPRGLGIKRPAATSGPSATPAAK